MATVNITETILRDAHQSLIATRMRTADMLPACPLLDRIGYWSLEVWGGATFDSCLRFLKEDPWERLRLLRNALPNTPLQMLLRGQNLLGYRHYSDDVVRAFVARSAANGIDVFRVFDALNDLRNLRVAVEAVHEAGKHVQGAISYTVSPVHSVAGFVAQARELAAMGCHSIVIKDMAGLLTPYVAAELFAGLRQAVTVPLHLHTHATAGLAEMCLLKAIENGGTQIDTAISAFAGGTSHAPTESMVAALRQTPYDTGLDLEAIQEIGFYFYGVRKKYHQYESDYTGVDTRVQVNQVPGGMVSNLADQLKKQNALNRMGEVLAEIPRVRAELGYPPLVTPTSQIVGTQAVMNVLNGERYRVMTTEVRRCLQGGYGAPPAPVDPGLQKRAIGQGESVITVRPADLLSPEMARLHGEVGVLAKSDEDVLSYAMFPDVARKFLEGREEGTLQPELLDPLPGEPAGGCPERAPVEFAILLHGETYHVRVNGTGQHQGRDRHVFLSLDGVPEEVVVTTLTDVAMAGQSGSGEAGGRSGGGASGRPQATQPGHIASSMMCTIIEVKVSVGDRVEAGQAVLITEAMKMETEIITSVKGRVTAVHVRKGDTVQPRETLLEIAAEE